MNVPHHQIIDTSEVCRRPACLAHVALLLSFVVRDGILSLEAQVITVVPALLWARILTTSLFLHAGNTAPRSDR
jgi:hypothetical protein